MTGQLACPYWRHAPTRLGRPTCNPASGLRAGDEAPVPRDVPEKSSGGRASRGQRTRRHERVLRSAVPGTLRRSGARRFSRRDHLRQRPPGRAWLISRLVSERGSRNSRTTIMMKALRFLLVSEPGSVRISVPSQNRWTFAAWPTCSSGVAVSLNAGHPKSSRGRTRHEVKLGRGSDRTWSKRRDRGRCLANEARPA